MFRKIYRQHIKKKAEETEDAGQEAEDGGAQEAVEAEDGGTHEAEGQEADDAVKKQKRVDQEADDEVKRQKTE